MASPKRPTTIAEKTAIIASLSVFKIKQLCAVLERCLIFLQVKRIMKLTVCFGAVRIVVPVINNDMLIKDLIDESVHRYKKACRKINLVDFDRLLLACLYCAFRFL
ncbi:partitioning-defective 3-like protein [Trichinella spiralis]|uniref:partitioning-defective 3-like protein n=1 Tax=Trichinella spiralis TaxID=6334 RepID=UPI0001EFB692|nr:partitioning-defective 3-like protein [Trichinella spiralis]